LSEPIRAEWASGRRKFSLALLLFWLGGGWLAVSFVIGLQILAVPRMSRDLGHSALLIPAWAILSLVLAVSLRRKPASAALAAIGVVWLAFGLGGLVWFATAHA